MKVAHARYVINQSWSEARILIVVIDIQRKFADGNIFKHYFPVRKGDDLILYSEDEYEFDKVVLEDLIRFAKQVRHDCVHVVSSQPETLN